MFPKNMSRIAFDFILASRVHPPYNSCNCLLNSSSMAKGIRNRSCWMEVAPAPIIFPTKPSNSPTLETITEEGPEEHNDKSAINTLLK
ncbi:hypothetical protein VNO77_16175 [Canavalia gladiata]|uniref:Uncharacterized protein n=1 Tax=Canavalia gladiata TaxID=3824 RepID=A0AAN9LZY9_CANGL